MRGILIIKKAYAIIAVNKRDNKSNGNEAPKVPALGASSRLVVFFSFVLLSIVANIISYYTCYDRYNKRANKSQMVHLPHCLGIGKDNAVIISHKKIF